MAAYPRKQTVFIFIICALITGGTAFYVYGQNNPTSGNPSAGEQAVVATSQNTTDPIVSNTDWHEQFLGSATSSAFNTASAKSSVSNKEVPLTQTDLLGRSFLTKYGELHQAGLTNNPDAVLNAMNDVVTENAASLTSPKTYSTNDIRVVTDSAPITVTYKNSIKAVLNQYTAHKDEASIAADALETGDTSMLANIDQSISDYKNMLTRLLAMPVPLTLEQRHIDLLNGISSLLYSAQAFRHIDTNPIAGFAAVKINAVGSQMADAAFSNI